MRKKDDTLREALLLAARELAERDGLAAVNIRSLARRAGVATGTVYNYFADKDAILLAVTEAYWRQALADMRTAAPAGGFCVRLEASFTFLRERVDRSGGQLMYSLGHAEAAGLERMASMQAELEAILLTWLAQDPKVRTELWDEAFSQARFVHFLTVNLMTLLKGGEADLRFFLTLVRRTLYHT